MIRRTLPLLAALGLAAGAAGCGRDNRGSVALERLCFPPTPDSNGLCAYTATCDQYQADGFLWVNQGNTLVFPVQIQNQRPDNTDLASGRTNTNFAIVERINLKYEAPGYTLPSGFVNQTFMIPAAGSAVGVLTLIPEVLVAVSSLPVGTAVVAKVSAHGRYGDDTQFDTAEFLVPIMVANSPALSCSDATKIPAACPQSGQSAVEVCITKP